MNPADDALDGPLDHAPEEVIFMRFLADRATSINEVAIALEETVRYLRGKEADGYVLDSTVDGGRIAIRLVRDR